MNASVINMRRLRPSRWPWIDAAKYRSEMCGPHASREEPEDQATSTIGEPSTTRAVEQQPGRGPHRAGRHREIAGVTDSAMKRRAGSRFDDARVRQAIVHRAVVGARSAGM